MGMSSAPSGHAQPCPLRPPWPRPPRELAKWSWNKPGASFIFLAVNNSNGKVLDETLLAETGGRRSIHQSLSFFSSGDCHPCQIHLDISAFFFFFQMLLPRRIFNAFRCQKLGHGRKKLSISFSLFHRAQVFLWGH